MASPPTPPPSTNPSSHKKNPPTNPTRSTRIPAIRLGRLNGWLPDPEPDPHTPPSPVFPLRRRNAFPFGALDAFATANPFSIHEPAAAAAPPTEHHHHHRPHVPLAHLLVLFAVLLAAGVGLPHLGHAIIFALCLPGPLWVLGWESFLRR
jgi:hypothetical protein